MFNEFVLGINHGDTEDTESDLAKVLSALRASVVQPKIVFFGPEKALAEFDTTE